MGQPPYQGMYALQFLLLGRCFLSLLLFETRFLVQVQLLTLPDPLLYHKEHREILLPQQIILHLNPHLFLLSVSSQSVLVLTADQALLVLFVFAPPIGTTSGRKTQFATLPAGLLRFVFYLTKKHPRQLVPP